MRDVTLHVGGGGMLGFYPGDWGLPCFRLAPLPVTYITGPIASPLSPTSCAWLLATPTRAAAWG